MHALILTILLIYSWQRLTLTHCENLNFVVDSLFSDKHCLFTSIVNTCKPLKTITFFTKKQTPHFSKIFIIETTIKTQNTFCIGNKVLIPITSKHLNLKIKIPKFVPNKKVVPHLKRTKKTLLIILPKVNYDPGGCGCP